MLDTKNSNALITLNIKDSELNSNKKDFILDKNIRMKKYIPVKDFGRLSVIFRDRRKFYFLYFFEFIITSIIITTILYKFTSLGMDELHSILLNYYNYVSTVQKSLLSTLIIISPVLLSSLFIYFCGYTIFSKVATSIWIFFLGCTWSVFSISFIQNIYAFKSILFYLLSAVLIFICIVFASETNKYSELIILGKAEIMKLKNVWQYTTIYLLYCLTLIVISYISIKLIL
ncbi:MAG: hypothetical protein A2Y17_03005 [Clostridiales bacterium GWF2_38_85]|nr:MAG: hypothetical protein A2Y17_03005 [Clostridiales bacterium GWF2_38_85]